MNSKVRFGVSRPTWLLACLGFALLGLLSLQSCKKEYFQPDRIKDATWNPELAVPLIKSTITVPEVLGRFDDQDVITIDSTGILALYYRDNIFSFSADSMIVFQDQLDQQSHTLTAPEATILLGGGTVTVPINYNFAFDVSNLGSSPELTSLSFDGGTMVVDIQKQFSYPASIQLSIPGLTINGNPFNQTFSGTGPTTISLAGATLTFSPINQVPVSATMTIGGSGAGAPGQTIDVTVALNGLDFEQILGDLKNFAIPQRSGEVRIRFFENDTTNSNNGTITWYDPKVKAIFTNGVGAGVQLNNIVLNFVGPFTSTLLTGSSPLLNNPTLNFSNTIGASVVDSFTVDRLNSNILTVAAQKPTKLLYAYNGQLNPGTGPFNNWIQDTSRVRLDMEVFLPFDGTAENFRRTSTSDIDIFPISEDIEEIEQVMFRLTIDNGFPADAHAQVYFGDSTLVVDSITGAITGGLIDSIFPNGQAVVFASPDVPASGIVDQNNKKHSVLDITVDRALLQKLETLGMRKIVARGWIDSYQLGTREVKIYKEYEMDLYLGVMVKAKVKVQL
ncbi:MAG: hypothetical protein IPN95_29455 [Bacteroidetes bacterium]|nr:hypothetical protein [Bacteroidota bacterium]